MAKIETVEAYYASLEGPLHDVAEKLGATIDAAIPEAPHAMWQGAPVWSAGDKPGRQPVALLKAYPRYITFGLWRGREVTDPDGKIDTKGAMASVKYTAFTDVDASQVTAWVQEAYALEKNAE